MSLFMHHLHMITRLLLRILYGIAKIYCNILPRMLQLLQCHWDPVHLMRTQQEPKHAPEPSHTCQISLTSMAFSFRWLLAQSMLTFIQSMTIDQEIPLVKHQLRLIVESSGIFKPHSTTSLPKQK